MTDEDIVGQALVAGFMIHSGYGQRESQIMPASDAATLIEFARAIERHVAEQLGKESAMQQTAIEAKVRDECAVICEIEADELRDGGWFDYSLVALDCAEAIRARGKK